MACKAARESVSSGRVAALHRLGAREEHFERIVAQAMQDEDLTAREEGGVELE